MVLVVHPNEYFLQTQKREELQIDKPRGYSIISLENIYFEVDSALKPVCDHARYAADAIIRLVIFGQLHFSTNIIGPPVMERCMKVLIKHF